jgi:divalent metal cation (Fe/Co/Zn/Cd) transporter
MGTPSTLPEARHLRAAFRVSAISVAWTVIASAGAITAGILARALVLVVFGLTGALDAAGSWTLALHFRHALARGTISAARERLALQIVSAGLIGIGLFTVEESTRRLVTGSGARASTLGVVITAVSIAALGGLTMRKRAVARSVGSRALMADSWLSATGAALAVIAIVGTILGGRGHAHWVDPVTALIVAMVAAAAGFAFLRREEESLEGAAPQ